jgi:type II secretory pathway predicted ATPase ExeA
MYETRFGLKRRPFPATPDDALYYPATGHEAALASLVRAIHDDEGVALLSGAPGTGKTLLGQCLCERVGAEAVCAFLPNSHLADRSALLQALLYDFQLPYEAGSEQVLRLRLTEYLLKNRAAGQRSLVIVDEAQHLSVDLLEELRLLGNLEAAGKKAVQIVLLAQPSLLEKLARPELACLRQRLRVRTEAAPLGVEEAVDYLLHHLRQAGGRPENIMDEAGLEVLARGAQGVPRLLNQAGDQALLLAHAGDLSLVDAEAALEALSVLGLEPPASGAHEAGETAAKAETGPRLAEPTRLSA